MGRRPSSSLFVFVFLVLAACGREEEIQTYRASKEPDPARPLAAGRPAPSKTLSWTVPEGWQELPPSSMRAGSFLIKGKTAEQGDISVVPLSGMAGGDLANINRWRGQIGLGPLSDADLARQSQTITPGGRRMRFVNFSNSGRRLMAAIYPRTNQSWFFKMTGEDATVAAAKPAFLKFLNSLTFHDHV